MGIDASIDALADALRAHGVDPPLPPSEPLDLEAIDAELAPMSLPAQVRRFWERVDPASLRVWAYPEPVPAGFAIDGWRQRRDEFPGIAPRSLLDVGYASHQCMSVELTSRFGSGGTLFEWNLVDGAYHLRYHDLSGWLDRMRELLEAGRFERHEGGAGSVLRLLDPDTSLPMSELPAPAGPNPVHGDVTRYQRHPLQWPPHWRRLSGISPEEVRPRGASHSISELAAADPSKPVEATIAGRVAALWGSGSTWYPQISDGTGSLVVTCPGSVTTLGPVMGGTFEFDVVAVGGEATATAIRPLQDR
jgi:hypothetical protein